jgi:hypothetical protein
MCRIRRLLMMGARVPETKSGDRPKLEDTTNPTTHGDWKLYVQN